MTIPDMAMNAIWSKKIDSILSFGVPLDCVGIRNWALGRNDAPRAIGELEALGVPILGGDVYKLVDGAVEQTYDNWYCDKKYEESVSLFLRESSDRARDYIFNYSNGAALFAIVPKY
ncbi:hypothetical protein HF319_02120 [Xanthomonas sp. Kuri4-1]